MKVSSTVKVTLESPDGNAVFVFKRPKLNAQLKQEEPKEETGPDKVRRQCANAFDNLVSVTGFEDENGKPISIEEIKNLDLDFATVLAILSGYNQALEGVAVPAEKKDLPSA